MGGTIVKLADQLKEHSILIRAPKAGQVYGVDCPKDFCQKDRAGTRKDCLKVEILSDSHARWKCENCLWSDKVGEPDQAAPAAPAHDGTWYDYLSKLNIAPEFMARNKVHVHQDGKILEFGYRLDGKSLATTKIALDGSPSVYTIGKTATPMLWGIKSVKDGAHIIIAQNELDALILRSCGFADVVALPNGGVIPSQGRDDDAMVYISHAADKLIAASRVTLALNGTPEGEKIRLELIRRIGAAKCYNVKFAKGTLINTMLDLGVDMVCGDVNDATPSPIAGLYELTDFERDLVAYFDGGMASGVSTGWENVDHYYTVVPAQLTLVTGIPNNGKSEWLDALTMNLAMEQGWRIAAYSPENGKEAHAAKLIEKKVMMPADPKSPHRMSRDTFLSGAGWVHQHFYFIAADSRKHAATIEWVLERARDAVLRHGIKGLIIDPFNRLRKSKDAPENVDQYVAYVLDLILGFAEMHGVHVWLVAHPKTLEADKKTRKYPVPSAYDISGGANFANMADNIIVIHRSEDIADSTEVHVKKIRFKHVGKRTQIPPLLTYTADTGRFEVPEEGRARYSVAEREIESIDPN